MLFKGEKMRGTKIIKCLKLIQDLMLNLIYFFSSIFSSDAEWNIDQFEDRLFEILSDPNGRVSVAKFKSVSLK